MDLDFNVKLECKRVTGELKVDTKYSIRELICDSTYLSYAKFQRLHRR